MQSFSQEIRHCADQLRDKVSYECDTAIILGSGLGQITLNNYSQTKAVSYSEIYGLPEASAPSHQGKFLLLESDPNRVLVCSGRHHLYEGYSAQEVCKLVYTLTQFGIENLIVTNAAGALNREFKPSDLMLISDHINFTGENPSIGLGDVFGRHFTDMSRCYDTDLRARAKRVAESEDINLHQGIYIGVKGPSLETSAERRMFRSWGADAVGMSTVLEVIAARSCGLRVLGISAITNMALGDQNQKEDTLENVLENSAIAGKSIGKLLSPLVSALNEQ